MKFSVADINIAQGMELYRTFAVFYYICQIEGGTVTWLVYLRSCSKDRDSQKQNLLRLFRKSWCSMTVNTSHTVCSRNKQSAIWSLRYTLAYVLNRAMAQRDTMNRAKMALVPEEIKTDKDIVINFFGNLEIYTKDSVWKEQEFHSSKCTRAVAYIMLHDKTAYSALAIADALYPEDTSDVDTINKNIRADYGFDVCGECAEDHHAGIRVAGYAGH